MSRFQQAQNAVTHSDFAVISWSDRRNLRYECQFHVEYWMLPNVLRNFKNPSKMYLQYTLNNAYSNLTD